MTFRKVIALSFVLALLLCSSAFAVDFDSRGSAVIPGVQANHTSSTNFSMTYLYITNVAGCDVDCKVTVYDHDGNDVTSLCSIYKGSDSSSSATLVTSGGEFSLPSGASRFARISISTSDKMLVGHASIEWASSNQHVKKALVTTGRYYLFYKDGVSYGTLPTISNQPF